MMYLSQLLGLLVEDLTLERVGRIKDILVSVEEMGQQQPVYPSALLIEGEEECIWRISYQMVERQEGSIRLRTSLAQLTQTEQNSSLQQEICLARDVFDKQVIDIKHKKAVRVNDVCFGDDWRILGIDTSTVGLLRRLVPGWLLGTKAHSSMSNLLPWNLVELIDWNRAEEKEQGEQSPPLSIDSPTSERISTGQLAGLHPADIAEIMHQLTAVQGAQLIERFDDEVAADTMEEIEIARQLQILENIQPARAADILQTMGPDEAADLLSRLPEERVQELLQLMTPKESGDVRELLEYEENTAGGLMTTDYLTLETRRTAQEALEIIRANVREHDLRTAYLYCVDNEESEEQHVLGVASIWDVLAASPSQALADVMEKDVISVRADLDPLSVAETMAKYNLLALPVLDEKGILQGIVTVDDALDVLLPPDKKRRPNRMY